MLPKAIQDLIERLSRLPGIGPRHATRLVFFILKLPSEEITKLAASVRELQEKVKTCPICFSSFETPLPSKKTCDICNNPKRIKTNICVLEKETDIEAIEKTRVFKGTYHIVGETVDIMEKSIPPSVKQLLDRITFIVRQLPKEKHTQIEVILAMNATVEGDALALYLAKLITPLGVTVTRLGRGLSTGSELEYADQQTLSEAFMNRKPRT